MNSNVNLRVFPERHFTLDIIKAPMAKATGVFI